MSAENEPAIAFSPDSVSFLAGALTTHAFYRRHERHRYRAAPTEGPARMLGGIALFPRREKAFDNELVSHSCRLTESPEIAN
jgi:hypothetical protein